MNFDPDTRIASLLAAIPSTAVVLERFGIRADYADTRSIRQICIDHGVGFDDFLQAFDNIDWRGESPASSRLPST